jgi:hypothetical protein
MAQGTNYNERVGRQIVINQLEARMMIAPNKDYWEAGLPYTNIGDCIRIMFVVAKLPQAPANVVGNVDISVLNKGTTWATSDFHMRCTSMRNLNEEGLYTILWDKTYCMGALSNISATRSSFIPYKTDGTTGKHIDIVMPCNIRSVFSGPASADIASNQLFICAWSNAPTGSRDDTFNSAMWEVKGSTRIRYSDH